MAADPLAGFTVWPGKTTDDVKKVWTVTFTTPIAPNSVISSSIYVTNTSNAKVSTKLTLSADKRSVTVAPLSSYKSGEYRLYITGGIKSPEGVKLVEQVMMPFTVSDPLGGQAPTSPNEKPSYILDVQSTVGEYVTNFTVNTDIGVYRVDVNYTKLSYMGDNTFSGGIFGLSAGDTVTVKGYDNSNRLLETYKYVVN
ncbi:hypothetical protein JCM15765_29340 [Paradesulfitobacterium aromaticivorans]